MKSSKKKAVEMFDLEAYAKEALFPESMNLRALTKDKPSYRKKDAQRKREGYKAQKATSK